MQRSIGHYAWTQTGCVLSCPPKHQQRSARHYWAGAERVVNSLVKWSQTCRICPRLRIQERAQLGSGLTCTNLVPCVLQPTNSDSKLPIQALLCLQWFTVQTVKTRQGHCAGKVPAKQRFQYTKTRVALMWNDAARQFIESQLSLFSSSRVSWCTD